MRLTESEDFSVYNGEGTVLRRAQMRMLDILIEFDTICRKHNISYWIDYGTLLGAVRHGGFIPWDDDLDVSIFREDYQKLYTILETELPTDFVCQDWRNEQKLTMKCLKIRDTKSYYAELNVQKGDLKHQGIFMDVFPIERIPTVKIRRFISNIYGKSFRHKRRLTNSNTKYVQALMLWPFSVCLEQCSRFMTYILKSKRVANIYGGLNFQCTHSVNDLFPLKEISFEGKLFYAPANYDQYLRDIYKDYMQIPPVDKRAVHATEIIFLEDEKNSKV
ncbi:MAG: LicD family protein [Crocinitomicaceae bacterium]|nr:LicD family protein [Crocinitomicaceae bacterium]